jgi:hypothetical protein
MMVMGKKSIAEILLERRSGSGSDHHLPELNNLHHQHHKQQLVLMDQHQMLTVIALQPQIKKHKHQHYQAQIIKDN